MLKTVNLYLLYRQYCATQAIQIQIIKSYLENQVSYGFSEFSSANIPFTGIVLLETHIGTSCNQW